MISFLSFVSMRLDSERKINGCAGLKERICLTLLDPDGVRESRVADENLDEETLAES